MMALSKEDARLSNVLYVNKVSAINFLLYDYVLHQPYF